MTRRYFKTKERIKKKSKSNTRLQQKAAREAKEKWLASEDGQKALARLQISDELSNILYVKSMTYMKAVKEVDDELDKLSQSLADKVIRR